MGSTKVPTFLGNAHVKGVHQNALLCRINVMSLFPDFEPSSGFFDRIIFAIRREEELRKGRKLAFLFFALLVISLASVPFSLAFFFGEMAESGVTYFVLVAAEDFAVFQALWSDFVMAVAESFPVAALAGLALNMILAVCTLRLFLHRKRLLLSYVMHIVHVK